MKKWIPVGEEKTIETKKYRYIVGRYDHVLYGKNCFRISKFLKENDTFIGHFVIVPEDESTLKSIISEFLFNEKKDKIIDIKTEAIKMENENLKIGDVVELKRDVERYPQFIAKKGERGTIVEMDEDQISAKMDKKIDGAEEWDNCLQWYKSDETIQDVKNDIQKINNEYVVITHEGFKLEPVVGYYGSKEEMEGMIKNLEEDGDTEYTVAMVCKRKNL